MKVYLLLCIGLILPGLHASAGYETTFALPAPGVYELSFSLDEFDISSVTHNGVSFSTILFENSVKTNLKGYAELPFLHASVQLPADRNVSLKVLDGEFEEYILTDPLLPSRGVIYRDQDPASVPYEISPASRRDEWYPQNMAQLTAPFIVKDIRGTTVYVYPFRYNAVQNILRVYKSMTLQLLENESPATNPLPLEPSKILKEMDPVYRSLFINYNSMKDLTIGDYGDILVICTDRDEEAMAPYVEWKREKGFQVTMESVAAGTNVKDIIQDAYDENNNILYVQLVGDWADIKSDLLSGYAPMDPQLGCVAGTDNHPDICIGRFSANSADDVTVQVEKVINYEKYPESDGSWYSSALGIASNQGPGDDGEDDNEHIDVIYDDKLEPFTYEDYTAAYDPGGTSQMVTNAINLGVGVINYCGHGSDTSWVSTNYRISHVLGLNNGNMLPIIFSVACVNGAFNASGDCFAEAWLKKEGGGAVMTMMSTINQPWNPPMRGQDYFNDLLTGGYDYDDHPGQSGINTAEGRTTIGAIAFNGLVLMCTEANGTDDWETAKTWHLFGDPSMQPRTDAPGALTVSNELVLSGVPFSTVITGPDGPLEGAMVCLSQEGEYVRALTDASGTVTLDHGLVPGPAKLVVTAFNMETIYNEVTVIPPEGAYIIVGTHEVDDSEGNNNGLADYGETVYLNISADNVGTEDALEVTGTLTSSDPYVSVVANSDAYGNIPAGGQASGEGAYAIEIAPGSPDGYYALMEVEFSGGGKTLWLSTFSLELHAPAIELAGYVIDDANGNGNGSIDPGEIVNILVELQNTGSAAAYNVVTGLSCTDPFITITGESQPFGDMDPGYSAAKGFSVFAGVDMPVGNTAAFVVTVTGDLEYSAEAAFSEVVGHFPALVIDMDGNGSSGTKMLEALEELDVLPEYSESIPEDISLYTSVFLCLGVYSDNHVLTPVEGQALAGYLNEGGNLYMEGGDTWFYDVQTQVHDMFGLYAADDGGSDLGTIIGKSGTFTEGMTFSYSGDNSWIDHIEAEGTAIDIFDNQTPLYGTGVAYDAGTYRTIAASHEFGGLNDASSPSTRKDLMDAYLLFFGLDMSLAAHFSSNAIAVCENETVNFYDMSVGEVITWDWEFEGGDPATSSQQNPEVIYNASGAYDVTLTVSNGIDSEEITIDDYIVVNTCTGLDEKIIEKISLFPNPNNGIFTLEIKNVLSNFVNIKVLSALSNVVYIEENVAVNGHISKNIDLSNLHKGMYFLVIENYQGSTINRIIIR